MERVIVVLFNGQPLVATTGPNADLTSSAPLQFLDWYADKYAFDRSRLSVGVVETIECPKIDDVLKYSRELRAKALTEFAKQGQQLKMGSE
jgi:hypothetical protein